MAPARNVKVVIINTQYVETDVRSFKSVVQSLTGKDSKIAEEEPAYADGERRRRVQASDTSRSSSCTVPVLSRGMSFREFEMMLKELPPLEELYSQIC